MTAQDQEALGASPQDEESMIRSSGLQIGKLAIGSLLLGELLVSNGIAKYPTLIRVV
jgi:hypothetical protein